MITFTTLHVPVIIADAIFLMFHYRSNYLSRRDLILMFLSIYAKTFASSLNFFTFSFSRRFTPMPIIYFTIFHSSAPQFCHRSEVIFHIRGYFTIASV